MLVVQQLINGVATGSVYALFAVGFSIVFSTMRIFNFAQGVYATCGALVTYFLAQHDRLPFPVAAVIGVIAAAAIAVVVDQVAFEPLRRRGDDLLGAMIASVAAWIALREVAQIVTGGVPVGYPASNSPSGHFKIGSITIQTTQILAVVISLVAVVVVWYVLQHTRVGAAVRAVGFRKASAQIVGINPRMMIIIAAVISGAAAGLAGILWEGGQSFYYTMGDGLLLAGFAAVVIGGYGNITGAALGGVLIGIVQAFSGAYVSTNFQDAIVFGLVLAVLIWRPRGLLAPASLGRA